MLSRENHKFGNQVIAWFFCLLIAPAAAFGENISPSIEDFAAFVEPYWGGASIQPLIGSGKSAQIFVADLPIKPPASVSLREYQTSVKTQTQGECVSQAFLGAIEATYKRNCINKVPGFASAEYCGKQNMYIGREEIDLSEQYLIHSAYTRWAHHGASSGHENGPSVSNYCYVGSFPEPPDTRAGGISGLVDTIAEGVRLPLEKDAPQFGSNVVRPGFPGQTLFTMKHLYALKYETGMANSLKCFDYYSYQRVFDDFQFDPEHISITASRRAAYRVRDAVILPAADARDLSLLEKYIANQYEVVLGLDLSGFGCPGNPPESHCTWDLNQPDPPNMGVGHAVLAIGYDRAKRELLTKNSWGPTYNAWMWIPYDMIAAQAGWGLVVTDVDVPSVDDEAALMGAWNVWKGGTFEGRLVIHRTRASADHLYPDPLAFDEVGEAPELLARSRWGTFYPYQTSSGKFGPGKRVVGERDAQGQGRLYIGETVNNAGDPIDTNYNMMQMVVWGPVSLDTDDILHIGSSRTALRDFAQRAEANWEGSWAIGSGEPAGDTSRTLTITEVKPIMNADGTYTATGTYCVRTEEKAVTGRIDGSGYHGVFNLTEKRCPSEKSISVSGNPIICIKITYELDATLVRYVQDNTLTDALDTNKSVFNYTQLGFSIPAWGIKTK